MNLTEFTNRQLFQELRDRGVLWHVGNIDVDTDQLYIDREEVNHPEINSAQLYMFKGNPFENGNGEIVENATAGR